MNERALATPSVLASIAHEAMLQRGLQPDFPPAVVSELAAIGRAAQSRAADIRDLRALPWCSIDNDDSRDLDQLTVAQDARILVAVADVDALVRMNSAIDDHAAFNTTSVYTAAGVFPMLPEKLSTDLTSLGENDERMAVVVDITVDDAGEVVASDVYRASVRNHAKLAYDS